MDIILLFIGALIFAGGYFTCYFTKRPEIKEEPGTFVKRVKPSLRNPLRTYEVRYDKYKSRDNHLLEPVRPKRKNTLSEVSDDV